VVLATALVAAQRSSWLRVDDRAGTWVLRQIATVRTAWLTEVANGINAAAMATAARASHAVVVTVTGCGSGGGSPVGRR